MDNLMVLIIGLICFIIYKVIEQNNKMEKLKQKVKARNNTLQSEVRTPTRNIELENEDTNDSDADDEMNIIQEVAVQARESTDVAVRRRRRKSKKGRINFIQNITGPKNNDNINFRLGVHIEPNVGAVSGGLGFLGEALTSGMRGFLNSRSASSSAAPVAAPEPVPARSLPTIIPVPFPLPMPAFRRTN